MIHERHMIGEVHMFSVQFVHLKIIKNVSSSTSHKKPRLYVRELKKIRPNTFIYELIFIKIHMNTNIMNTQIFHVKNYDLKGHWRSQKFI